jgi:hypothetical protein
MYGLPQVDFTPLESGVYGTTVPLGILSEASLQKVVEVLQLPRGDTGPITIDREIISRLEHSLQVQTFNFRSDIAKYIFGAATLTSVTADASASIVDEAVNLPPTDPFARYVDLANGDIDESTVAVDCAAIADEAVGTGDGATNAFLLDYKVKAVGDVTSVTVAGVAYTPIAVGAAAAGNEVEVIIGETDGAAGTGSGSLEFHVGGVSTPPASGAAIVASYAPSFTGADFTLGTDFQCDPYIGRIRFLDPSGADNSPFRTTGDSQPMLVDYDYDRKAHVSFLPGTQPQTDGKCNINLLPDPVGINLVWSVPSATIRLTDDELAFNSENFATATMIITIQDAGGSDRWGTIKLSSEAEANA